MHLHAAFVPPAGVRRDLAELIGSLEPASPEPEARRGRFGRRTTPDVPAAVGPQLSVQDPDRMLMPITDFGYLASGDARRLAEVVGSALGGLAAPTVRLHGGSALVDDDDRCVWAELTGDEEMLSALGVVARRVVSAVEPLGLFRDRRQFKPRLAVATITDATTVDHLETALAALAAYTSEPWVLDEVSLLQRGSGVWQTLPVGRG